MLVRTRVVALVAVLAVVAGCGASGRRDVRTDRSVDPSEASTGSPMPTTIPPARGPVTSTVPVTVLDAGAGPVLCLGPVAMSLPPQCGGPRLVGFRWADHRGAFEQHGGVRWGLFVVTGTFDGRDVTVSEVVPIDGYPGTSSQPDVDLTTPCPAPAGGWRVLDPERTTDASLDSTMQRATRLPGYAEAWLDQSRNPAYGHDGMTNDPAYVTINVRVTRDLAGAERELRRTWGGALCVSRAVHTERRLLQIQHELTHMPGLLSSSAGHDRVDVQVVHDDGSLQAWADATYGPGLVRISSALVPASG